MVLQPTLALPTRVETAIRPSQRLPSSLLSPYNARALVSRQPMNIFFDCDYTIIAMNGGLRPGVRDIFRRLKEDGHTLYVWSGMGIRWLEVRRHGLEPYVTDCFHKPLSDYRARMYGMGVTVAPDLVIDDYPDIVTALGGVRVKAYLYEKSSDREMERLYPIITALGANAHSAEAASPGDPQSPAPQDAYRP